MLNMTKINSIRDLHRQGDCKATIAKKVGIDVKTVSKYLQPDDYSPVAPVSAPRGSKLDPYKAVIDEWLEEDRSRWYKQRHTATRIHHRLLAETDYRGSYPLVQRYVHVWRSEHGQADAYQELVWHPGEAQVDFGEADFYLNGNRLRLPYLVISFPYSNASFVQICPNEQATSVCEALQAVFVYIGCVPSLLIFDNAAGVGKKMLDTVAETELFQRFHAHYGFALRLCNPNAGHEKGHVEGKVGFTRRNMFVPEPHLADVSAYNVHLLGEQRSFFGAEHYKKGDSIATLFAEECAVMSPLPPMPFDVCEYVTRHADGFGKICLDGCHYYSSRSELANRPLLVAVRTYDITIYDSHQREVTTHRRQFGKRRTDNMNPETTLKHLSRHPGSWFNCTFRETLDDTLRDQMDALAPPARRQVLRSLYEVSVVHGFELALQAMTLGLSCHQTDVASTTVLAARLMDGGIDIPPHPGPDLGVYDDMLKGTATHD